MDCLMLLAPVETSLGYTGVGDFAMTQGGRIERRARGEPVPFVFAGVSMFHPRLLDGCPSGRFSLNVSWDQALASSRLHGLTLEGTWMHVGDPVALGAAERRMRRDAPA